MVYEYKCTKCDATFDVTKSVKDIDVNEFCEECGSPAIRKFVPSRVHFTGTKVTNAEYNPAFGCVVKDKQHKDYLSKKHNVIEVGNDFKSGESQQKHFDNERETRREKRWEKDD